MDYYEKCHIYEKKDNATPFPFSELVLNNLIFLLAFSNLLAISKELSVELLSTR